MSFKVDAQLHFLTYPQCDVPLEEMLRQLKEKYGDKYGWCVISAEDHAPKDDDQCGGVHRHVQVFSKKRFQTTNARYWDLEYQGRTYHPNYKPMDNKRNTKHDVLKYVIKDGVYITDGMMKDAPFDINSYLESVKTKGGYGFTYVANQIKQGKTLDELDDTVGGIVCNHKRKIEDYIQFQKDKKIRNKVRPTFPGFAVPRLHPQWAAVAEWANKNFLEKRGYRQKQLWLWSRKPKMAKSHPWLVTMAEYYVKYEWNHHTEKQGRKILDAQYLVLDELKGGISVTDLKSISQMMGFPVEIKYGDITEFDRNIPLIVTSNRPPAEVYHKCPIEDIVSLEDRFEVIEVKERYHLQVKAEVEILVPSTPSPTRDDPELSRALLGTPQPEGMDDDKDLGKEDISEMSDSDDDRNEDDHSQYSNEGYTKEKWIKKYRKDYK